VGERRPGSGQSQWTEAQPSQVRYCLVATCGLFPGSVRDISDGF